MNKFIFKMGDADVGIIEEIFAGLFLYYGCKRSRGLALLS
jgi:hypothetical protein